MGGKQVPLFSLMFSCLVFLSLCVVQEERDTLKKAGSNKELQHVNLLEYHLCLLFPVLKFCH